MVNLDNGLLQLTAFVWFIWLTYTDKDGLANIAKKVCLTDQYSEPLIQICLIQRRLWPLHLHDRLSEEIQNPTRKHTDIEGLKNIL